MIGLELKAEGEEIKPTPMVCGRMLLLSKIISEEVYAELEELYAFRNALVHNQFSADEHNYIELYTKFSDDLRLTLRGIVADHI